MELETKSMFIRYVSHEIRNPLNCVMLGLDHLEEVMVRDGDGGRPHWVDTVREIKEGCAASLRILNDMLTSDKIRSGFLVLERRNCSLQDVLSGPVESLRSQVGCLHIVNYICMNISYAVLVGCSCWSKSKSRDIIGMLRYRSERRREQNEPSAHESYRERAKVYAQGRPRDRVSVILGGAGQGTSQGNGHGSRYCEGEVLRVNIVFII